MAVLVHNYQELKKKLGKDIVLVAVSKTKPAEDILELYNLGHRDFGENYVQELVTKAEQFSKDIHWHFIGHLQSNKVKQIVSFVHLIHGVDSIKLLKEINKQAEKCGRVIDVLLQVHIATEETKFGFNEEELIKALKETELAGLTHVRVCGLMGMASFTDNMEQVGKEFKSLKRIFNKLETSGTKLQTLSMGMSSDYKIAVEEGSNMVRIGSLIFGERK